MTTTLKPGTDPAVPCVVWRDNLTYDATPTVYWPLDRANPIVSAGPVRAPAATIVFVFTDDVWDALTSGKLIALASDCGWKVPARTFVVQHLAIQHAEDDPYSTRLIHAGVQTVAVTP